MSVRAAGVKPRGVQTTIDELPGGSDTRGTVELVVMADYPDTRSFSSVTGVTAAAGRVATALRVARRSVVVQSVLRRVLIIGAVAGLVPLLAVVGDHFVPGGLPGVVLGVAGVGWAVVLGVLLVGTLVVNLLQRLNPVYLGREIERAGGIRHNVLVNALLLQQGYRETSVRDASVAAAAGALDESPPEHHYLPRGGVTPYLLALTTVVAWLLYLGGAPKPVSTSLARFFGADLAAPTATRLVLLRPGAEDVVHAHEPLEMVVAMRGQIVEDVRLFVFDAEDAESGGRLYLPSDGPDLPADTRRFVVPPVEVVDDVNYRFVAGDGVLEGVVAVQPLPSAEGIEIELVPPAYTGWSSESVAGGDFSAFYGTRARFVLRANTDVADPVYVFQPSEREGGSGETRTRMRVDETMPTRAFVEVLLTESGVYRIEFADAWGYAYAAPDEHWITVLRDERPVVRFIAPDPESMGSVVDARRVTELVGLAEDDVGVVDIGLVIERGDAVRRIGRGDDASVRRRMAQRVAMERLGLKPGELVRVWFEAVDNRVDLDGRAAHQAARSEVLTLVQPAEIPQGADAGVSEREGGQGGEDGSGESESENDGGDAGEREAERGEGAKRGAEGEAAGESEAGGEPRSDAETDSGSGEGSKESDAGDGGRGEGVDGGGEDPESAEHGAGAGEGGSGSADGEDAGEKLREFLEEHGEDAREAADAAGQDRGAEGPRDDADGQDSDRAGESASPGDGEPGRSVPRGDGADGGGEGAEQGGGGSDGADDGSRGAAGAAGESGDESRRTGEGGGGEANDGAEGASGVSAEGGGGVGGGGGEPAGTPSDRRPPGMPADAPMDPGGERGMLPETGGLIETLDLLDLLERGVKLEARLVEAGWTTERAAGFMRALERLRDELSAIGDVRELRRIVFDTRMGTESVQSGGELSGEVSLAGDPVARLADALRQAAAQPEQGVTPGLERLLEAYYRALADRAALTEAP